MLVDSHAEYRQRLVQELAEQGIQTDTASESDLFARLQLSKGGYAIVLIGQLESSHSQHEIVPVVRQELPDAEIIMLTSPSEAWQSEWTPDRLVYCTVDREADRKLLA